MKFLYLLLPFLFFACKTEIVEPATSTVNFELHHKAGGQSVQFDTIIYDIPSGFDLSITRWQYYISGMQFLDGSGNVVYQNSKANYIDARQSDTWNFRCGDVPLKSIKSIKLTIGLVPEINLSNTLPNTAENIGMAWPDVMGGGYHFMKLEGHYSKGGDANGFAMHLGNNGYQVNLTMPIDFTVPQDGATIALDVDALEWFTNPYDFDFDVDGNYTMGIPALMQKLSDNGATVISNVTVL